MLPKFPYLKKIELSDKTDIESYTCQYPPCSAFNFTNLWTWDTESRRMVADLHGNLVVLSFDYHTNEPFFAFLGTQKVEETVLEIASFAETLSISPQLRFITEESVQQMRTFVAEIQEDRGNHDYVFSVRALAKLSGNDFKSRKQLVRRFLRHHPSVSFEIRDITDKHVHEQIASVLTRWEDKKKADKKECDFTLEKKALMRLLKTARHHNLVLSCVAIDNVMVGFGIDEILPNGYAISHFVKADSTYKGVYEFLNKQLATYLGTMGVTLWNWQQDLEIEGLRKVKMSYRPVRFLKRYTVMNLSNMLISSERFGQSATPAIV